MILVAVLSGGMVALVVSYLLHAVLLKHWRKGTLHSFTFIPLWLISWIGLGSVAFLIGSHLFVLVVRGEYGVILPLSFIVIASGVLFQIRDLMMYEDIRPFLRDTLFLRHSSGKTENIFAGVEQQKIERLALSAADKKLLKEIMSKKRIPMDQARELLELETIRAERARNVGREELALLAGGSIADITDIFKLHHIDTVPHPAFQRTFKLTIEPAHSRARARVVFNQDIRAQLDDPTQWFRFEQDLYDYIQSLYTQDWMARFKPFFSIIEVECHQQEMDSFGLPKITPFLRVEITTAILDKFADQIFIPTELENVATVTWLEGE